MNGYLSLFSKAIGSHWPPRVGSVSLPYPAHLSNDYTGHGRYRYSDPKAFKNRVEKRHNRNKMAKASRKKNRKD